MRLPGLQKAWNEAGKTDPFWAVLSDPQKKGNRWEIDEFFQTGVTEVDELMRHLESLRLGVAREHALDFGCGPGRLSQALGRYFDHVDGVDISPSMIELARQHNRLENRVEYRVNDRDDLQLFPTGTFDLVYSSLTLQHVKPALMRRYLQEFFRILRPGGVAVFQLPSRPAGTLGQMKRWIPGVAFKAYRRLAYGSHPANAMYGMTRPDVLKFCARNGATVIDVTDTPRDRKWESFRYVARPSAAQPAGGTPARTPGSKPPG
jgi:SAM-dependent methyltransferase